MIHNTHTGISDWGNCTKCRLHADRHRIVVRKDTRRNSGPHIFFIGEAPGADEDFFGRPFEGRAGNILDRILERVRYPFSYTITNTVCCRPIEIINSSAVEEKGERPVIKNRQPTKAEMDHCRPHIDELIQTTKPDGLVYLGQVPKSYKPQVHIPSIELTHPAAIARLEYLLLPVKKQAHRLSKFIGGLTRKIEKARYGLDQ